MNARIETYSGATNLMQAATHLKRNVLPNLHLQPGYRGGMASVDERAGVLGLISLWDDAATFEASDLTTADSRDGLVRVSGGHATVEVFGDVVSAIGDPPPQAGCPVSFLHFRLDPARVDDGADVFATDILPSIVGLRGFRAVRKFTNVHATQGLMVIIGSDEAALSASVDGFVKRRANDMSHGICFVSSAHRHVLLVDRR